MGLAIFVKKYIQLVFFLFVLIIVFSFNNSDFATKDREDVFKKNNAVEKKTKLFIREDQTMANNISKPYYTVQVNVRACKYDIRINDVPLIRGEGNMTVELPASPWVFSGINTISFELSPLEKKDKFESLTLCKAILYQRQSGTDRETRELISGIIYDPDETQNKQISGLEKSPNFNDTNPPKIEIRNTSVFVNRPISLETPFPRWSWLDCPKIPQENTIKNDLLSEYRRFWIILESKNTELIKKLTDIKASEIATAYYFQNRDKGHEKIQYMRWSTNKDVYLADLITDDLELEVLGDGHLAQLVDGDKDSPIVFVQKDQTLAHYMPMMYCKTPNGWLLIR